MSAWAWIGVALLGGVGAGARVLVDTLVFSLTRSGLPTGTLAVNTSGSLLLGLITGLSFGGDLLVLTGAATLGSYTTFSTWMLESQRLTERARVPAAVLNVLLSLVLGLAAVALGRTIGAHL